MRVEPAIEGDRRGECGTQGGEVAADGLRRPGPRAGVDPAAQDQGREVGHGDRAELLRHPAQEQLLLVWWRRRLPGEEVTGVGLEQFGDRGTLGGPPAGPCVLAHQTPAGQGLRRLAHWGQRGRRHPRQVLDREGQHAAQQRQVGADRPRAQARLVQGLPPPLHQGGRQGGEGQRTILRGKRPQGRRGRVTERLSRIALQQVRHGRGTRGGGRRREILHMRARRHGGGVVWAGECM